MSGICVPLLYYVESGALYLFVAQNQIRPAEAKKLMIDQLRSHVGVLFDSAPLGIVAITQEDRIALANPALEALFGYTAGELLGQPFTKRLSELMGGTMWVESVPDTGSTFHVTFTADHAG